MVETAIKPQEYTPDPDVSAALKGSLSTMPEGLRDPYEKAFEAQRKNQFDMLERERVQKANLAQAKAGASGGLAAGMQRQYDQFNKMEAPPKLNVTPETREGLIGMASLLPIAGLILGAGGMSSGVNAMKALTGIINGHAEGNKERIEFEKQKYDAAMKDWEKNYNMSRQKLTDALEMMKTNYQAGVAKAEAAAVAMGPETAAILRREGLTSLIGKIDTAAEKARAHQDKLEELAGRQTQASKAQQGQNQRLLLGTAGAASAFEKIAGIRAGTTAGILPFLSNKEGILNYLQSSAGRTLSSDDAKILDVYYTGVARNLAAIEAAGAASGLVGLTETFKKIQPMAGDSNYVVAAKMADARRIVEESMNAVSASGVLTPQQDQEVQTLLNRFAKAVPYTLEEVNEAVRKKGKKQETIGEATRRVIQGPEAPSGTKKSAEDRFNELEASGMPEADIFKKMQGEGY